MSSAFKSFVADLFDNEECSDCVVRFCLSKDSADCSKAEPKKVESVPEQQAGSREAEGAGAAAGDAAGDADIVEPLPAHSWVLRPGSSYFKSQLERWTTEQPVGSRPALKVPVGCVKDVDYALEAISYIYTGRLGISSAAGLLGVRRLACYIMVDDADEACDAALLALVDAKAPSMAGVVELYACRHLLPAWDDDPTAAALVDGLRAACQAQLAAYKGADTEFSLPGGTAKVPLGKLLAWAFPDAPSVLSDPAAKSRVQALPASSLEALLSCDTFATDNEASVLLLLAEWLDANPTAAADVKKRLSGCIRLCQLSDVYLYGVLPRLPWSPLSEAEVALLFQALKMPEGKGRERLLECAVNSGFAWPPVWTSGAARPGKRADAGRPYKWSILGTELGKLTESNLLSSIRAIFPADVGYVVTNGFAVWPEVQIKRGENAAGIFLTCDLPASVKPRLTLGQSVVGLTNLGMCRLTIRRTLAGVQREAAFVLDGAREPRIQVGRGLGFSKALPLLEAPTPPDGAAPDPLARWAPYLYGGRLSGALEWLPEDEDEEKEDEEKEDEEEEKE